MLVWARMPTRDRSAVSPMVLPDEEYTYPDNVWDQLARLDVTCSRHPRVVLMRLQMHTFKPELMTLSNVHLGPSKPPNVVPDFGAILHLPASKWVNDPSHVTLRALVESGSEEHTEWKFGCSVPGCGANIAIGADKAEAIAFSILSAIARPGARCVQQISLNFWTGFVQRYDARRA